MKIRNNILIILIAWCCMAYLSAQKTIMHEETLDWQQSEIMFNPSLNKTIDAWIFQGGILKKESPYIAGYSRQFELPSKGKIKVSIQEKDYLDVPVTDASILENYGEEIEIYVTYSMGRNKNFAGINFIPAVKTSQSTIRLLKEFEFKIEFFQERVHSPQKRLPPAMQSELSEGQIYKIGIPKDGIYKIDFSYLQDSIGLNPSSVEPDKIRILSHGPGPLAERISEFRTDDLSEIPLYLNGLDDGSFDQNDFSFLSCCQSL